MNNKFKFVSFSLLIILILALSFGCTPTDSIPNDEGNNNLNEEISMGLGFLNEKYIIDDKQFIMIEANEKSLELEVLDHDLFDSLESNEYYMVSYNENSVVKSIESNEYIKGLVLNYTEQDPDSEAPTIISKGEKFNTDDLTLIDAYIMDINNNGEDEIISMYTRAEKDSNGEIMWDDGQDWVILVEGEDSDYILFKDYVQLGSIQLYVYTIEDELYISTITSSTASLAVKEYRFNTETEEFEANIRFTTSGNVNMLHSTK